MSVAANAMLKASLQKHGAVTVAAVANDADLGAWHLPLPSSTQELQTRFVGVAIAVEAAGVRSAPQQDAPHASTDIRQSFLEAVPHRSSMS